MGCLWFIIARFSNFEEDSWVVRYGYENKSIGEQYLAGVYFIITTVTTVGYGDNHALSSAEKIFCCILMIIGVISYTLAISYLASIINARDRRQAKLLSKLEVLDSIRNEFGMNFELYWRLRQSLQYETTKDMSEKQQLLNELPLKLKVDLTNTMYSHEVEGI